MVKRLINKIWVFLLAAGMLVLSTFLIFRALDASFDAGLGSPAGIENQERNMALQPQNPVTNMAIQAETLPAYSVLWYGEDEGISDETAAYTEELAARVFYVFFGAELYPHEIHVEAVGYSESAGVPEMIANMGLYNEDASYFCTIEVYSGTVYDAYCNRWEMDNAEGEEYYMPLSEYERTEQRLADKAAQMMETMFLGDSQIISIQNASLDVQARRNYERQNGVPVWPQSFIELQVNTTGTKGDRQYIFAYWLEDEKLFSFNYAPQDERQNLPWPLQEALIEEVPQPAAEEGYDEAVW